MVRYRKQTKYNDITSLKMFLKLYIWSCFYCCCSWVHLHLLNDTNVIHLWITFRLEKEYTTIKNKEMEEQVEIKVCEGWSGCKQNPWIFHCMSSVSRDSASCYFAAAADGEPAVEAEDRHAWKSECSRQCSLLINLTLTHVAMYTYISIIRLLMMEPCLSLTGLC